MSDYTEAAERADTAFLVGVQHGRRMALLEAADAIEAELVCCDVYDRRDMNNHHHICYWGGAAASLVRSRAIETTSEATP